MNPSDELVRVAKLLDERGLNSGTSGNVSVRTDAGILVTPSAISPSQLTPDMTVLLSSDGVPLSPGVPTSEWRIHTDVYRAIPGAGAIVHTHSTYATALACLREDLPAFHYQVAKAGGHRVACSPYAPFGTQELSDAVIVALGTRHACLMANHGMLAYGTNLALALDLAMEIEVLCRQYLIARSAGSPVLLSPEQMDDALGRFSTYGTRRPDDPVPSGHG